jgi:hypothetical protein
MPPGGIRTRNRSKRAASAYALDRTAIKDRHMQRYAAHKSLETYFENITILAKRLPTIWQP